MRRASLAAVLIAVCCVFMPLMLGALGLGALSGQLDRYVPLVIVLGAGAMAGVTYRMSRRRAQQVLADDPTCDCRDQRRAMLLNAMLALLLMAVGFLLVQWLKWGGTGADSAIQAHPAATPAAHAHTPGLIHWVEDAELAALVASFGWLGVLALLPFPRRRQSGSAGVEAVHTGHCPGCEGREDERSR